MSKHFYIELITIEFTCHIVLRVFESSLKLHALFLANMIPGQRSFRKPRYPAELGSRRFDGTVDLQEE